MSRTRVIKGSKVIPYVVSMGVDLWPIHWPISGHCTYGKLYLFWINIAVQLIWANFQWDRTILKIWPCTKGRWPFPLYSFILTTKHCIDIMLLTFLLLMTRGRIWDMFQPNWSIFEFYPHITVDLWFHGQNVIWKNARHVCLAGRSFLSISILIHEFPNTNKMGTGFWSETYRLTL